MKEPADTKIDYTTSAEAYIEGLEAENEVLKNEVVDQKMTKAVIRQNARLLMEIQDLKAENQRLREANSKPEPQALLGDSSIVCQCGHRKSDHFMESTRTVCQACKCLANHRFAAQDALDDDLLCIELEGS